MCLNVDNYLVQILWFRPCAIFKSHLYTIPEHFKFRYQIFSEMSGQNDLLKVNKIVNI